MEPRIPYSVVEKTILGKSKHMKIHQMGKSAETTLRLTRGLVKCGAAFAILALMSVRGQAEDAPSAVATNYAKTVTDSKELLAYWPLAGDLKAAVGDLQLLSSKSTPAKAEGPFGLSSVDLSDGSHLFIKPSKELDNRKIGVEMLFQIVKPSSGNLVLFGLRSHQGTRFSLHYNAGDNTLIFYNGGALSRYVCNDNLAVGQWYHVALGIADGDVEVWLNGKKAECKGDKHPDNGNAGMPFVVGASNPEKGGEHADIKVAHLALYKTPLSAEEIVNHMKVAGWESKMAEQIVWQKSPVSILESQIGYHPRNTKHVYLRSTEENPPEGFFAPEFTVHETKTGKEVFRGKVEKWGKKWDTFWWVLDFTPLRLEGEFHVKTGKLISTDFKIEEGIYHKTDLTVIALDQLEHRIHQGIDDPRAGMKGKYENAPPDTRIYMDCGSPYSELQPVGTCVYALFEMHDRLGKDYSEKDRKRMIDLAAMGADYFVAAQRHSDDPELDGMFHHSLLVNTNDTWAGKIFTYLDTAYGMALLAKSHQFFKTRDPARAKRYLAAAEKAWNLCVHRPFHTKADRTIPQGCNAYFWNAPAGIQDSFGRGLYNILDKDWTMPDTLRTRDRLPFIQGSALMYEITQDAKYLDKAVEFADAVLERQFTDWENPIEDCFGTFYEFEGNNEVFFHEFMQGGFWWQGNVEAMNLEGFMHLLRLAPRNPKAAEWLNAIHTYAENYARKATTKNPLGIYPVAVYKDPEHGGLKYFQNTLMGSSCLFGFSAKNFMMLGDFLKDSSYQLPAIAGVNFIAGLNPGIPNAYEETAWDARTLIQGVGRSWFGPAGDVAETARGSVPNGFCAAPQFWLPTFQNFISYQTDKPRGMVNQGGGLQFNEGWILHSHAYVHGVTLLESAYALHLKTLDGGKPVMAEVVVELKEQAAPHGEISRKYQTADKDGIIAIRDLPTPCEGTVTLTHGGRKITRPVAAIAGGKHAMLVDFAQEADIQIQLPEKMKTGGKGDAAVIIENQGSADLVLEISLTASGMKLGKDKLQVTLKPGTKQSITVPFECGSKVMPCMVRAMIDKGAPSREFIGTGRIASK